MDSFCRRLMAGIFSSEASSWRWSTFAPELCAVATIHIFLLPVNYPFLLPSVERVKISKCRSGSGHARIVLHNTKTTLACDYLLSKENAGTDSAIGRHCGTLIRSRIVRCQAISTEMNLPSTTPLSLSRCLSSRRRMTRRDGIH